MDRSMRYVWRSLLVLCLELSACARAAAPSDASRALADKGHLEPSKQDVSEGESAVLPDGRVPIRWFVGLGTGMSGQAQELEGAFVEAFNAAQAEIELSLEVSPRGGVYDGADWLRAEIEAGRAPDVVGPMGALGASLFPGLWLDLALQVEGESDILEGLVPEITDAWRVDGRLVGLGVGANPSVLYYNRDLFDAADLPYPPHQYGEPYADGSEWTIEKMQEIAMRLTLDAGGNDAFSSDFDASRISQYGYDWRWASGKGMAYLFGAGSAMDANGNAAIPEHWRQAYHWYHEGMWKECFIPNGQAYRSALGYNPFASGRVAMLQSHLWYLSRLADVPFSWDIAALPSYNGRPTVSWDSHMVGILNTTPHPKEALKVARALIAAPELLAVWGDMPVDEDLRSVYLSVLEDRYPDVDWQPAIDGLGFLAVPPHGSIMPNHAEAYARFDDLRDAIENEPDLDLDAEIETLESDLQAIWTGPAPDSEGETSVSGPPSP